MNAEPPIARFQMEHQLRRPGYAGRYTVQFVKNQAIELHDSTLAAIQESDGDAVIELRPAYIHASDGKPGSDPGDGLLQDADIIVSNPMQFPVLHGIDLWISDGSISTPMQKHDNVLQLPFATNGRCSVRLLLQDGQQLAIEGNAVQISLRGKSRFLETCK